MKDYHLALLDEVRELTLKKRAGYAPGEDPMANFSSSLNWGVSPKDGIVTRMQDKISRAQSLVQDPGNEKVGESLRDTMIDLANYALIYVAYRDRNDDW